MLTQEEPVRSALLQSSLMTPWRTDNSRCWDRTTSVFSVRHQVPALIQKFLKLNRAGEREDEETGSVLHILQPKSEGCLMFSETVKKGIAK